MTRSFGRVALSVSFPIAVTLWLTPLAPPAAAEIRRDPPPIPAPADAAVRIFERFCALEGHWIGKSTKGWTEEVEYRTIAGRSAVMYTSFGAHPNETMSTFLHPDGGRLLLTHYCVAKNQPRLVLTEAKEDGSVATFEFLEATGISSRDAGHMDKVVFRFADDGTFASQWTWYQDGTESWMEEIRMSRAEGGARTDAGSSPEGGATSGTGEGDAAR